MTDLDLRQLRYLVTVAEEGAITAAADRLSMTQPALSRAVRALEDLVGTPLLVRQRRGIVLTDAGQVLVEEARDIGHRVEVAVSRARRAARGDHGLRVSARGCDAAAVESWTRWHNERFPQDRAVTVVADWRTQLGSLHAGETDLTLMRGPFDGRGLDSEVVAVEPRVALVPAGHVLAERKVVERAELSADPVAVWSTDDPAERDFWLGVGAGHRTVVVGPEVGDMLQMLARVRLGEAIIFVSRSVQQSFALPADVRVLEVTGLPGAEIRLAWREDERSPAVARFVRAAADRAAEAFLSEPPGVLTHRE